MRFLNDKKLFNSAEEVVSMFLGLVIVGIIIGLVFTFFQKRRGDITLPGVSNYLDISQEDNKIKNEENLSSGERKDKTEYTVIAGDNLWKIAEKEYQDGFKWNEIAKANGLNNPRLITVGQKLLIPNIENKVDNKDVVLNKPSETINEYTVTKNDSLWKVAVSVYGDGYQWTKIWDKNKDIIKNPNVIYSGTKLLIPKLAN
jgi:nucleoid-associated protein YgaU